MESRDQDRIENCAECGHELDSLRSRGLASPVLNATTAVDPIEAAIADARNRAPNPELEQVVIDAALRLEKDQLRAVGALVALLRDRLTAETQESQEGIDQRISSAP